MSLVQIFARVCPLCRHDCARVVPWSGLFRLECGNEHCRGFGMAAATEGAAVVYWNKFNIRLPGIGQ